MKKYLSLIIAAVLMLSVAACGKKDDNKDNKNSDAPESAVSLLETVWNTYGEDEKFAAAGGDSNEANAREDAPGVFGIDDTDALDSMLGFPAAAVDKIDGAASLMHMMNQNTFGTHTMLSPSRASLRTTFSRVTGCAVFPKSS